MKINLADIPDIGKSFEWNTKTGELNKILKDLIGTTPHTARFFIKPLNTRDFELTGQIETEALETCSRCGIDFKFSIRAKMSEILIPRQPQPRNGKYAKVNHVSDSISEIGPGVTEYDNLSFDAGEYIHEIVGLEIPPNPAPAPTPSGDCSTCGVDLKKMSFSYSEQMPEDSPKSPFLVLKNVKL